MSSRQYEEWIQYAELEPFGFDVENFRAGSIASTVANCMSQKHDWKPSDFMPRGKVKPKSLAKRIAESFGIGRKK